MSHSFAYGGSKLIYTKSILHKVMAQGWGVLYAYSLYGERLELITQGALRQGTSQCVGGVSDNLLLLFCLKH